jgi:fluoride exporter
MPDSVPPSADADVDVHVPAQRRELTSPTLGILLVISVGGVLGTLARYGLSVAFPHGAAGFPGATFAVNVAGCGLIGVLMVCLDQLRAHRLVRPFLGVGCWAGSPRFPPTSSRSRRR